jgi:hypothetical protein
VSNRSLVTAPTQNNSQGSYDLEQNLQVLCSLEPLRDALRTTKKTQMKALLILVFVLLVGTAAIKNHAQCSGDC